MKTHSNPVNDSALEASPHSFPLICRSPNELHRMIPSWAVLAFAWGACLAAPVMGQTSALRLQTKVPVVSETIGFQAIAIGGGKIAVSSIRAVRPGAVPTNTGGVHIFDAATGKFVRTQFPADGAADDLFGSSVAISGNVLVVGAIQAARGVELSAGAVYLYNLTTGALIRKIQQASWMASDFWGTSVAIDGDIVLIGGPFHDTGGLDAGAVMAHTISTNSTITVRLGVAGDRLGTSVGLSGLVAALGAVQQGASSGYVSLVDASTTASYATVTDPVPAAGERFGESLSISGHRLVVGMPLDDRAAADAGRVCCYDISNPAAPLFDIAENGANAQDYCGKAVIASPEHEFWSVFGGDFPFTNVGHVRHHSVSSGIVSNVQPAGVQGGDLFGASLGFIDNTLVVAASNDSGGATDAGAVWRLSPFLLNMNDVTDRHAQTGDSAPGAPNAVFSAFTSLSMPSVGGVGPAFFGKMSGTGATGTKTTGLWEGFTPPGTRLAQRSGLPTVLPLVTLSSFTQILNQQSSLLWFRAKKSNGLNSLFYHDVGGFGFLEMIKEGSTNALIATNEIPKTLYAGRAPSTGLLFSQPMLLKLGSGTIPVTAASDTALYVHGVGFIREGVTAAPAGIVGNYGQLLPRAAHPDSQLIISAFSVPPAPVQFVVNNGILVAKSGDAAPGTPGVFSSLLGETVLKGAIAHPLFRATLAINPGLGITAANNEGLWGDAGFGLAKMVQKGDTIEGMTVSKFLDYGIDSAGNVLMLVQFKGTGITASNDLALIRRDAALGLFSIEVREGTPLPGCDGARVASILAVDMPFSPSGSSFYGVLASLVVESGRAKSSNNLAWLTGNIILGGSFDRARRFPTVKIRKGERYLAPTGEDSFTSIALPATLRDSTGAANTGLAHVLSANGVSSVVVTYPNKKQALITKP